MMSEPSDKSLKRMQVYTKKYWEKTGTSPHPDAEVTNSVITGLALNIDELGRPLCPCNFYPDKQAEIEGCLAGIKGQYLIFDDNRVLNIRKHNGYRITMT